MLPHPPGEEPLRIVSFDPGTDTFGAAEIAIDLSSRQVSLEGAHLFRGSQLQREFPVAARFHGDLFARLLGHEENLLGFLHYAQPHVIVTETPYMGRFAASYGALSKLLHTIHRACWRYDQFMSLRHVDPSTVKKYMGVKGTSGDKNLMTRALLSKTDLLNPNGIDIAELDEHRVDAICIGYYQAGIIIPNLPI